MGVVLVYSRSTIPYQEKADDHDDDGGFEATRTGCHFL